MHTLIIVTSGFVILAICLLVGKLGGRAGLSNAAALFLPIWLACTLVNMWVGVTKAGYPVKDELPFLLIVFSIPAIPAFFLWWKTKSR